MLVEGGGEDHLGLTADAPRHVDATQPRHAYVQKAQLGLMFEKGIPGIDAIDRLYNDLQLGPGCAQRSDQLLARRFLVVGYQRAHDGVHADTAVR